MAGMLDRFRMFLPQRTAATPAKEQGVPGFSIYGGYVQTNETNQDLLGSRRWLTAADMLANISIVAASARYFLNLTARPAWKFEPVDDTPAAREAAEFMESVVYDIDTSWTRIVRRSGMFRFHGFGIHEWVTKKRDDGRIGIESINPRPQHTVKRWDLDENGKVRGVLQTAPQDGKDIYLPRCKLIYFQDDMLSDAPDGMGWFRHLVEPQNRLKRFFMLEGIGFERDLAGIPVGRAPIEKINKAVKNGNITEAEATAMINGIKDFVKLKAKQPDTGLVIDSKPYQVKTDTGLQTSSVMEWGIDLLTGGQNSLDDLGKAINRTQYEMALIMGTESMLVGREGEGSRALSSDKSDNLYMNVNSTLADMSETYDRDLIDPIWDMNGFDPLLKPKASVEDASHRDVEQVTRALADMANAGAILSPNDPAINEIRSMMNLSDAEPVDAELIDIGLEDDDLDPDNPKDPELAEEKTKVYMATRKAKRRTLYVCRPLENAADLIAWARKNGFTQTLSPEDMHVTVLFSKNEVDWLKMGRSSDKIIIPEGGPRVIELLGDKGAAVIMFGSGDLSRRHDSMIKLGASHDYPEYQPHVTISYSVPEGLDVEALEAYTGELIFGPEKFAMLDSDWDERITEQ